MDVIALIGDGGSSSSFGIFCLWVSFGVEALFHVVALVRFSPALMGVSATASCLSTDVWLAAGLLVLGFFIKRSIALTPFSHCLKSSLLLVTRVGELRRVLEYNGEPTVFMTWLLLFAELAWNLQSCRGARPVGAAGSNAAIELLPLEI